LFPLEYTGPDDSFYDYCLWEYKPISPWEHKLRSVNLLFHSFEMGGLDKKAFELVESLRGAIGMFHTVWGIKHMEGRFGWEFYFYDYRRRYRERSVTKVLEAIRPFIACDYKANENLSYFMFSLDVSPELLAGKKSLEEIHMYLGNPGSTVSSGVCYSQSAAGARLENLYFFFDARRQMDEIRSKAASSAHFDSTVIGIDEILWPELRECKIIVAANKQRSDSLYFSGITLDQLLFFLKKLRYPEEHVAFVEQNGGDLDHMLYDVGFDYRMEGEKLCIQKSGYYGIF
jgi:hypothetical protein